MTASTGGKRTGNRIWPVPLLFLFLLTAACGKPFDDRMDEEARRYTARQCPQALDAGSRLDSLTYTATGRTLTRWITLHGPLDDEQTRRQLQTNPETIRQYLLGQTATDADLQEARRHGVTFRFVYRSASLSAYLHEITLTPDDYRRTD